MESGLAVRRKSVELEICKVSDLKTAIVDPVALEQDAAGSNHDPDHDRVNFRNDLQRDLVSKPKS